MELVAAHLAGQPRLLRLAFSEASRRARHAARTGLFARLLLAGVAPETLPVIPGRLTEGDPRLAAEIYGGSFRLANRTMETGGRSPFLVSAPSRGWQVELHSFEWLRHLEAAGDALAGANARILVSDWMRLVGSKPRAVSHDADVAARRLLSWLAHSDLLLHRADQGFRRRFLKSLAGQLRFLRQAAPEAPDGLPRLLARIALVAGTLSLQSGTPQLRLASRLLAEELDRQVFADGVHVSRDPAAAVTILAELLPLARLLENENQPVPKSLVTAVDRMLPMLRFFRHGDGALALFNGAGTVDAHLVTTLMRHDPTLGEPISHARQGGYQRLSAGGTVLIADTGAPPPLSFSGNAHAGTLAFEFSAGSHRFVVNCGAPQGSSADMRRLARTTAAHSTLTLADHSSSRFETTGTIERLLGQPLIAGPTHVPASREDASDGMGILASHDGYAARFGLTHERTVFLSRRGDRIEGVDRLAGSPRGLGAGERANAAIRFHLHPDVAVRREGESVVLSAGPECWSFHADSAVAIEDGMFLADPAGPRRSVQIVLSFDPRRRQDVAWSFIRRKCPTADAMARQNAG
ncbi:heparinase II/III family protein [Aureimonas psammosilenae]|uniref:heparinase II/III family protein n=1 Tax=Aureimonas psammosilenae TaxID=2495496 RepID=UPI001260E038|nr:heparinase II/III family protein [Aureimonas psammosilenae]